MSRRATAIFISGRGSNMEALIGAGRREDYPAEIRLVISNRPEAAGLSKAAALGVATLCIDQRMFAGKAAFEAKLDDALRERGIEIIACAGFMRILSEGFAARWEGRLINIHPSLLPSYPGLDTHARALADGVRIHGCTVHFMTAAVDAGPIIAQAALPVAPQETAEGLAERVLALEHEIYPLALGWLASGKAALKAGRVVYGFAMDDGARLIAPRHLG